MKNKVNTPSRTSREAETLTIRMAVAADQASLRRLAQLDSAAPPAPVPTLVAEVAGDLRAALPLDDTPAIANPFERTAELVAMLVERAQQLKPSAPRRARRRWLPLRLAHETAVPRP